MKPDSSASMHVRNTPVMAGMTLVELLVALAIAMLLFGGLTFAFRAVQLSEKACEDQMELIKVGQVALERISRDLRSCYPMKVQLPEELTGIGAAMFRQSGAGSQTSRSGTLFPNAPTSGATMPSSILTFLTEDNYDERLQLDQDSLRLTAAANDPRSHEQPSYDIVEIAYYIDIDPRTEEEGLVRAIGLLPGLVNERATGEEQKKFVISPNIWMLNFRYLDDANSQWLDEWRDFEKVPAAVEVTIGIFPTRVIEQFRSQRLVSQLEPPLVFTTIVPITIRHIPTALSLEQLQQTQQGQQGQEAQQGEQVEQRRSGEPTEVDTR